MRFFSGLSLFVFGGGSQAVNGAGLKIRAVRKPVPQARRAEGFVGSNPTPRTSLMCLGFSAEKVQIRLLHLMAKVQRDLPYKAIIMGAK